MALVFAAALAAFILEADRPRRKPRADPADRLLATLQPQRRSRGGMRPKESQPNEDSRGGDERAADRHKGDARFNQPPGQH
ncbi:MAG: hypothetical protein HYS12_26830 [Planctomycetes bacterium]|nr:hypothetical protein [Planctomycetota bacterium]